MRIFPSVQLRGLESVIVRIATENMNTYFLLSKNNSTHVPTSSPGAGTRVDAPSGASASSVLNRVVVAVDHWTRRRTFSFLARVSGGASQRFVLNLATLSEGDE
jgi:hypothetical protein